MRLHEDPRLTLDRAGQVEFRLGAENQPTHGTARHHEHEFHPYEWRDPARARYWARLPPDLVELMQTEKVKALPSHQTPAARPPGFGPPAGRGPSS